MSCFLFGPVSYWSRDVVTLSAGVTSNECCCNRIRVVFARCRGSQWWSWRRCVGVKGPMVMSFVGDWDSSIRAPSGAVLAPPQPAMTIWDLIFVRIDAVGSTTCAPMSSMWAIAGGDYATGAPSPDPIAIAMHDFDGVCRRPTRRRPIRWARYSTM